jgi:MFS family permease
MLKNHEAVGPSGAQFGGVAVVLLALSLFINYVDRGNLSTAAPLIRSDLRLSNVEYGLLVSAFFWIYAPGPELPASGWASRMRSGTSRASGRRS